MSRGARWTIGVFATVFALTSVYSETTAASKAPLVMYLFIVFCFAIAVACFSEIRRSSALRVVGGITFIATIGYLVYEIVNEPLKPYPGRSEPHWINAIFALLVFGLPGLALATRKRQGSTKERHQSAKQSTDWLTQSVQMHLVPALMKQGFEVAPPEQPTGLADRDYLHCFPQWGRMIRARASGVDLIEIQFAKHQGAAFRLNAGIVPNDGLNTWAGHRTAKEVKVHSLEEFFETHARPWLRRGLRRLRLEPLGEWFSVWCWPWQAAAQEDFEKLALRAASIVPEVDLALREGRVGPHIRRVFMPWSRRPQPTALTTN